MINKDLFETGLKIRKEVAGNQLVENALKNATEFSMPMQEFVTEFCWGAVWGRPGLDRRSRSILNLGMLSALNRPEELAGHIRGALQNGVTKSEIQEIFLQASIYLGMPTGLNCFKIANQVFSEDNMK